MSENVEDHFYILKRMVGYVSQKCDICSRNEPILKVYDYFKCKIILNEILKI